MPKSQILIHVGYPKTASTWLQKSVFADDTTGYFAPWGAKSTQLRREFVTPAYSNISAEVIRKTFEPGLQEAAQRRLIPVLSDENLSGTLSIGKGWKKEVVNRIHDIFPQGKIFVVIREQKSMLLSAYRQHVGMGHTSSIQKYIGTGSTQSGSTPICQLQFLNFDELIEYYQKLFGRDNVIVLPFELLKKDVKTFFDKLNDFTGASGSIDYSKKGKNVGIKGVKLATLRQLNFLFPPYRQINIKYKVAEAAARVLPHKIHESIENSLQEFIAQRVGDSYRQSNQRTSQLIGINLAEFGYDC
ncbi:hypothetical protein [Coleofasciculus sp.]|uniref:hypothetical protein n=1 Tax=Coleofasciculus sp. TaxID=3100458 RepID=UPI003A33C3E3